MPLQKLISDRVNNRSMEGRYFFPELQPYLRSAMVCVCCVYCMSYELSVREENILCCATVFTERRSFIVLLIWTGGNICIAC